MAAWSVGHETAAVTRHEIVIRFGLLENGLVGFEFVCVVIIGDHVLEMIVVCERDKEVAVVVRCTRRKSSCRRFSSCSSTESFFQSRSRN